MPGQSPSPPECGVGAGVICMLAPQGSNREVVPPAVFDMSPDI